MSFDHYVGNKEWSNPIIKHRLQDAKIDTYNCGVFVCCFLERLQELNFDLESELSLDDLKNKRYVWLFKAKLRKRFHFLCYLWSFSWFKVVYLYVRQMQMLLSYKRLGLEWYELPDLFCSDFLTFFIYNFLGLLREKNIFNRVIFFFIDIKKIYHQNILWLNYRINLSKNCEKQSSKFYRYFSSSKFKG